MNEVIRIGGLFDKTDAKRQAGGIYDPMGLCPTISTCEGGYREPSVITEQDENKTQTEHIRIRRLTSREAWRLMGFTDEDYDKAKEVCSETQLFKQAGNSIVVDVLCSIFGEML